MTHRPWAPGRALAARPRLLLAFGVGAAVVLAALLIPNRLSWSTVAIAAWDCTCFTFIAAALLMMRDQGVEDIAARAAGQDEGQGFILGMVVLAAAISLGAIGVELSRAKDLTGALKAVRVGLVAVTVTASWFMVQLIFALHYAHEYYAPDDEGRQGRAGGLAFPGDEPPDYWDFLHFSVVIGVAAQTADIAFTSKRLRRIGTVQSAVVFGFNTAVLALAINLLASLF